MVNIISHLGIGLLIAEYLGLEGNKRKLVGFLAILPDLDFFTNLLFTVIDGGLDYELRSFLFYLLVHREFMHTPFFILIVVIFLWYWKKDRLLAFVGFLALLSHFFLDYSTSWDMHPLYPFSINSSSLASTNFFDPVVLIVSAVPLAVIILGRMKSTRLWNSRFNIVFSFVKTNEKKIYSVALYIFIIWCVLTPTGKFILIDHISGVENEDISYQNTYSERFGTFISAYPYNQTHYKILEFSYWSGIGRSDYIEKRLYLNNSSDNSRYIDKTKVLYNSSIPKVIDYPVYVYSENNSSVIVNVSDARNQYVDYWAYFDTVYEFVFDKNNGEYNVYAKNRWNGYEELSDNRFNHE